MHPASTSFDFTDLGSDEGCEGLTIVFSPRSIPAQGRHLGGVCTAIQGGGWRFLLQDAQRVTVTTTVRIPL